jgi:glycosyltransferase involved in cell wall biosynthesis
MTNSSDFKIAIAIPCHNEEATVGQVIDDFRKALPQAQIFVFNNASHDKTADIAAEHQATVVSVPRKGKGNVLRAIFDHMNFDAVIVVDGDGTYHAQDAAHLLKPIQDKTADMTVGNRLGQSNQHAHFYLNRMGTQLIVRIINVLFGTTFIDVLSGYRVFNARFIQTVPLLTTGFETETEMTIQALEDGLTICEIPITYHPRPLDSPSKLRPFQDGWRILMTIAMLLRDHYPLRLYGVLAGLFWLASLSTLLIDKTNGQLSGFLFFFGILLLGIGFILSAINTRLREIKQIILRNFKIQ